jgi:hypothetical protein
MKFTNVSDATGEADVLKVDVSAPSPPAPRSTSSSHLSHERDGGADRMG